MSDKDVEIGTRIKKARQSRGLTQLELARDIGASQTAVALWESGNRKISTEVIERVSVVLSVSASYLLFGEKDFKDDISDNAENTASLSPSDSALVIHFSSNDFTEEELEDIRAYAEFIKSKRQKKAEK
jgi:transcriptional regulator with XRE-family HTH domain